MKAAVLFTSKKPLEVIDIDLPSSLDYGQVLVNVNYSGICGAQINEIDAVKGEDKFLPHLMGHEGSGVVEKIGDGVTTIKVGDHVVMHWRQSKGIQSNPPKYKYKNSLVNAGWITTFNEKAIVSENRLTVIPKDFDMYQAPLFGCAVTTAFGVINNDAKIKIGQSILVIGLGGVGLNIVQAANMVSANPILGIDILNEKIDLALKFGLSGGLNVLQNDWMKKILTMNGDNLFDVVIETTGKSEMIEKGYELTHQDGKTILVGVPNNKINIYSLPLHFNKILTGSHGGSAIPDIDIPKYIELIKNKKMSLDKMITNEFSLDNINEAINLFRTGKCGRIMLKINP